MPQIETKIWMAIKTHIQTNLGGKVVVAWPGETTFTPPHSGSILLPYLAVAITYGPPQRQFLESRAAQKREGTLSLVYVAPLGPVKAALLEAAAALINPHFREDGCTTFTDTVVQFTSEPALLSGYRDDGYWRVPVNVRWRARVAA